MQINLTGKVAIVTGAGRGIGKAIAKALATANASVVINDVDLNAATQASQEIESSGGKARPAKADVRIRSEINQMVQIVIRELGGINILVNNAGVILRKPAEELSEEEWDKVIDINLKGTFLCAQTVAKAMIQEGNGGKIINVASIMGSVALPPRAAYCASKGGIIALTKDLAGEWAKYRITVNTVSPGWAVTEMTQSYFSQEEVRKFLLDRIPLNRLGKPEDVVNLAVFLASEYSDYITGQAIYVDGGCHHIGDARSIRASQEFQAFLLKPFGSHIFFQNKANLSSFLRPQVMICISATAQILSLISIFRMLTLPTIYCVPQWSSA